MLNAFIWSPPEILQYSCHAQSGGVGLYAGGGGGQLQDEVPI